MSTPKKDIFSDLALGFNAHPVTGQLSRKKNREAVKQSVKSLILTDFYERPFKPDIGCSIRSSLFELFTPMTQQKMQNAIREVISNYEPRAEIIDVYVEDNPDLNALTVSVAFYIKNDPNPVVLDVILERVR
jgi:phage baseplate assembly protein W